MPWVDAVGIQLYLQFHSTARGSRSTVLQAHQTAPQAIPQAFRSIPQFSSTQFPSRGQASSHSSSSLVPSYITRPQLVSLPISSAPPHSSLAHPTAPGSHCSIAQLPAPSQISQFSNHIPVLNLAYIYLPVVLGCSFAPHTNSQPEDN